MPAAEARRRPFAELISGTRPARLAIWIAFGDSFWSSLSGPFVLERRQEVLGPLWTGHFEPHRPVARFYEQKKTEEATAPVFGIYDGGSLLYQVSLGFKPPAKASGDGIGRGGPSQEAWQ